MTILGKQARAARALVEWPRGHVAGLTGISEAALLEFEAGRSDLPEDEKAALQLKLEEGGAVFLPESDSGGIGVRLRFTAKEVRALNRMENEGGPVGMDDV